MSSRGLWPLETFLFRPTYPFAVIVLALLAIGAVALTAVIGERRVRHARRERDWVLYQAQKRARRYAKSLNQSPIPLAHLNPTTRCIVEVNDAFLVLLGRSREELIGAAVAELGIGSDAERAQWLRRLERSGLVRNITTTLVRGDGHVLDILIGLDLLEEDGELQVLATVIDQSDANRALAALRATDERMRELTTVIDEVLWVSSPDRRAMHYISPTYERLWGRPCRTVYADAHAPYELILDEDRERIREQTVRFNHRDPHDREALYSREFRIRRDDGSIRWIRSKEFPVRDPAGTVLRIVGVATDITDQRLLEDQLRQAQKMESLGMLAGGIAHDFNNLLAVISSCSGLLAETIGRDSPDAELVDDISEAVVRASALTRQLLAFSRKHVAEAVVLDPNIVVTDTRKLLRRIVGETIEVETSLEPELRAVRIDRGHLVQVILNLAVNARDAMPTGGRLRLATRNHGESSIVLEIADTGSGMAPDVVARACEPFFTTKELGKGTGMGLAVVHGIVDQAGGKLELDSEPDHGTTVRIVLPAHQGPLQASRTTADESERGVETILIVDDDEYVRRATARALRARGYNVVEAGNGRAALAALPTAKIDLMLTDIVMPGMNGRVLAEAARARFPDLKVVFMTGYTDDEVVKHGVARGEVELIEKPFTIQALALKVRGALDAEVAVTGPIEVVAPGSSVRLGSTAHDPS